MDDLISRRAVIRWVKANCNPYGAPIIDYDSGLKVMEHLKKMPAAEKRGKWIKDRLSSTCGGSYGVYRCSECENSYQDIGYGWNYCPNCGARMEE